MSQMNDAAEKEKTTKKLTGNRARPLPPDVNARNLAIEKRRRNSMNRRFSELANCVPALASSGKPASKTKIVNETLNHLRSQHAVCIAAARDIRCLLLAHEELVSEVNLLRSQLGIPTRCLPNNATTPAMASFLQAANETSGGEISQESGTQSTSTTPGTGMDLSPYDLNTHETYGNPDTESSSSTGIDLAPSSATWQSEMSKMFFPNSNNQEYSSFGLDYSNLENTQILEFGQTLPQDLVTENEATTLDQAFDIGTTSNAWNMVPAWQFI